MAEPASPTVPGGNLAEALRSATWAAHRTVERNPFVRALLHGELDRAAYCLLLRSLHTIYAALERQLAAQAGHPALAALDLATLRRRSALESDLGHLHGPGWRDEIVPQAAALGYARHLDRLAASRPELLLAHAYVRYLGDLSGGQALRRVVACSFDLPGDDGTRFYEFGDAPAQAGAFRAALAAVAEPAACHADVVAEACAAFDLHERLFDELERSVAAC